MTLIENWKSLWKAYSVQMLALGAILPEILQLIADNSATLPWLDDGYKSGIRLACIILAMVLRAVHQPSVSGKPDENQP
jgi:hypothetical protein